MASDRKAGSVLLVRFQAAQNNENNNLGAILLFCGDNAM
jgi:hypothetical protein